MIVEHPTLGELEFPDDTPPDAIRAAIRRAEEGARRQPAEAPQEEPWYTRTPQYAYAKGIMDSFSNVADVYKAIGQGESPLPAAGRAILNSPGGASAEAALAAASGVPATAAAGLAGLAVTAAKGPEAGAKTVENVSEALAYAPRGEMAGRALASVGDAARAAQNFAGEGAVSAGESLGIDPNSPAAAALYAAGATLPEAAGMAVPALRAKAGRPRAALQALGADDAGRLGRQGAGAVRESAKRAEIRQAIQSGDKAGAKYRIDPRGRVVADPQAAEAIKQGFSDGAVATIKNAPKADKIQMLKMLDTAEKGLKNPLQRARSRPSDVIGESVMRRWKKVADANMQARKDINAAAQTKLKGTTVDITDVVDDFADDLGNLGVQLGDDGLNFRGSQIEGSNIAPIKRVFERLKAQDDGLALHRLKQYIDEQIDWDKPGQQKPLSGKSTAALKRLRNGINEKLKAQSQEYADANARASETFGVMGDMMDVMGRRFDPMSENAGVYAGQELRKVLSNYQKRADLVQAIDRLDEVAGKYGGQFADDPINQVVFLNDMERLFGSFADNSFQGGIEKGVGRAARVATGSKADMVITAGEAIANKVRGIGEEGALKAMRELLKRE